MTRGPERPAIRAMKAVTEVPVLFAVSGDPVELGLVKSLARPGGNFTGSTFLSLDSAEKRVELLKDVFPQLRRLAVLSNADHRKATVARHAEGGEGAASIRSTSDSSAP